MFADTVGLRMSAGGTLGWLIGQPLFIGVTAIPAIILLVLLGAFGGLLISGIPLVEVPNRIRDAVDRLGARRGGSDYDDDDSDDYRTGAEVTLDPEADLATTRLRRPSRRRQAAAADDPGVEPDLDPAAPTRPLATTPARSPGRGHHPHRQAAGGPARGPRPGRHGRATGFPDRDPASAGPDRRHRVPAAARDPAETRCAAEGPVRRERRHDRADHRRARAVQRGRRRHRLHPRPDRHPVRGRARTRASRSRRSPR